MEYIALFRGINIGGKARVEMARLRVVFENMGFTEVSTYINSGNVIFTSAQKPNVKQIQQNLAASFGFDIPTLILAAEQLREIVASIPSDWENNYTDQKSDVAFLLPEVDSPNIMEKIGRKPDIETIIYVPGALLSNISRKNQPKSSLLKVVGTPLYGKITVRNVTTVRKLAMIVQG